MKLYLIILLTGIIQIPVLCQHGADTVWITKDIELVKISENAYVHISFSEIPAYGRLPSNGLLFINNDKAFLFDTPVTDSLTRDLVNWISDSMKLKIVGFIPNHWHNDCMGGIAFIESLDIESYANQITIDIAKEKQLPLPRHGFKDSITLKLNDEIIDCYYLGAGHTADNIVVWIPSERILFGGCMVKDNHANGLGNTADSDLKEWPNTIDRVIEKFKMAKIVIPGHGQSGGIELLIHTRDLLRKNRS
jgi:metallo-beta-lactamase class B